MLIALVILLIVALGLGVGLIFLHRSVSTLRQEMRTVAPPRTPEPRQHAAVPTPAETKSVPRYFVHDLNNLLGTIRGFTDAAMDDLPLDSPLRRDLSEVLDASDRAQNVVKQWDNACSGRAAPTAYTEAPISKQTQSYAPRPRLEMPAYKRISSYPPVAKPIPQYEKAPALAPRGRPDIEKLIDRAEASLAQAAQRGTTSAVKSSEVESRPQGREHLLIVDDEPQLLTMFRRIFEPQGYKVTTFSNGLMAWDDFQKHSDLYDLAMLDQRMPEMSGTSLAIEMLNCRPDFPIILLSGFSDTISPDDATRIGIRRFLSKPIPQSELADTIRKTLDESHLFHS